MTAKLHAITAALTVLSLVVIAGGVVLLQRFPNLGVYLGLGCMGLVVLIIIYVFIYSIVDTVTREPERGDWP